MVFFVVRIIQDTSKHYVRQNAEILNLKLLVGLYIVASVLQGLSSSENYICSLFFF